MQGINIMDYVVKESLWLIPVLMGIGFVLKQIPTNILPDWAIPVSLYAFGIFLGYIFIHGNIGMLQGLLCATAAIGFHQGIKQPLQKKE